MDLSKGVNLAYAWYKCESLSTFPAMNTGSATSLNGSWRGCSGLASFPDLDTSSCVDFRETWQDCYNLTSFPPLNFSSGLTFMLTWLNCTSLASFPPSMFDSCSATGFQNAWTNCALSQESVDNILVSLDTAGQINGTVGIDGGTSAAPSSTGLSAKLSLAGKGWTVLTN